MRHSNIYHELGGGYKRRRVYGWLIAVLIVIIVLLVLAYYGKASAMDYKSINKCIETYKAINQDGVRPLYPVGQCIQHPNTIN